MEYNNGKFNRKNLLDKQTWRWIGMLESNPKWTIKDWRNDHYRLFPKGDERYPNPYISCSCCGKEFTDDEYPYQGAFSVAPKQYMFRIICKECAYRISDKVIEADGTEVSLRHVNKKGIIKYVLNDYSQQPEFKYLVQRLGHVEEYWLYNNFDSAYNKMKALGRTSESSYILEPYCVSGEWRMKRTFRCFDGKVYHYGNDGDVLLHAKFYIEAGEWKNYSRKGIR